MNENVQNIVRENIDNALEQADELLKKAATASDETAKQFQEQAKEKLTAARKNLCDFYSKTSCHGKEVCEDINTCVHKNPWRAVGVAAAAGLLLGLLLAKK